MNHKQNGQAIIEVLVAVSMLTVGFLGVVTLLSKSLGLNRVVSESYTATYLAVEGVEIIKNLIDANIIARAAWNQGLSDGTYEAEYSSLSVQPAGVLRKLNFDPLSGLYGYGSGEATPFTREIKIAWDQGNSDHMRVTATVRWVTRGGGQFESNVEDHFYNWRP